MNKLAAIQMVSGVDLDTNLSKAQSLLADAVSRGASLVLLPENFALMGHQDQDKLKIAEAFGLGPIQTFLATEAKRHQITLIGGTIPIGDTTSGRVFASCLVYDPTGNCLGRYDKIHLFNVDVPGEIHRESDTILAGTNTQVVTTKLAAVGLSVCYDLRFPEHYRTLVKDGSEILVVPSAFTQVTGAAHWEPLLRARAIENFCYVIAANQGGTHENGRMTYGNSMIIDPWGKIEQRLGTGEGVIVADFNHDKLIQVRQQIPALDTLKTP